MDYYRTTLHKAGLQRRKLIREWARSRTLASIASELGISRQRVHQLVNGHGKKKAKSTA